MNIVVNLSGYLADLCADGASAINIEVPDACNLAQALDQLWTTHLALRDRVVDEHGKIREHVAVFVGTDNLCRNMPETKLHDGIEIFIFPAVSGG